MNATYLSISELNQRVATLLERQIPLLWVQGEISNLTRAASGHWYFSLKDHNAQVRAVMFRHKNSLLNWQPREGDAVHAQVLAGLYAARGEFQLSVETMRPAGLGTLYERFLKLKDELAVAGWFDATHKKPLPKFVRTIGIVTSPQAAALRDVLQTLARRAPHVNVLLYPTLVQGEQAAQQIAKAIQKASTNRDLDALLVVRGGGSLEDLWSFNEKIVAQAIKNCHLPVISGVGHETDTTIADFMADVRAATPTAAAELISSPSAQDWFKQIEQRWLYMKRSIALTLRNQEQALDRLAMQLLTPAQRLAQQQQHVQQQWLRFQQGFRFNLQHQQHVLTQSAQLLKAPKTQFWSDHLLRQSSSLQQNTQRFLEQKQRKIAHIIQSLAQLNPDNVLARGYVYVKAQDGSIVYNAQSLQSGDGMIVQFQDGRAIATVNHIE